MGDGLLLVAHPEAADAPRQRRQRAQQLEVLPDALRHAGVAHLHGGAAQSGRAGGAGVNTRRAGCRDRRQHRSRPGVRCALIEEAPRLLCTYRCTQCMLAPLGCGPLPPHLHRHLVRPPIHQQACAVHLGDGARGQGAGLEGQEQVFQGGAQGRLHDATGLREWAEAGDGVGWGGVGLCREVGAARWQEQGAAARS